MPKVTVLMTVYNGMPYLPLAIESILAQTWTDFEFLIVNDGSKDRSRDIITSYEDSRIRLIDNPVNIGQTASLNRGLKLAKGDFIARLDQDDLSLPDRLEKQMAYMAQHPHVVLLGTWCQFIDEAGNLKGHLRTATSHQALVDEFVIQNPFTHSSVMYQRACVQKIGGYPTDYLHSQDFALWLQIIRHYQVANLPEELVQIRLHAKQATFSPGMKTARMWDKVRVHQESMRYLDVSSQAKKAGQRTMVHAMLNYAEALLQQGDKRSALRWVAQVGLRYPHLCMQNFSMMAPIVRILFGSQGYGLVRSLKRRLYHAQPMQSNATENT